MDEWHFPLLGELCAPMDNKNKSTNMIAFQRRGGRAGISQPEVSKAPNYAPEESSLHILGSVSMVVRIA